MQLEGGSQGSLLESEYSEPSQLLHSSFRGNCQEFKLCLFVSVKQGLKLVCLRNFSFFLSFFFLVFLGASVVDFCFVFVRLCF